jgi:hypothetical protein
MTWSATIGPQRFAVHPGEVEGDETQRGAGAGSGVCDRDVHARAESCAVGLRKRFDRGQQVPDGVELHGSLLAVGGGEVGVEAFTG